jgi:hypothetical protein
MIRSGVKVNSLGGDRKVYLQFSLLLTLDGGLSLICCVALASLLVSLSLSVSHGCDAALEAKVMELLNEVTGN